MELESFSYYFVITKTPILSYVKHKLVYHNQYSPIKNYQRIYDTNIYIPYNMGEKYYGYYSCLWSEIHFSTIL